MLPIYLWHIACQAALLRLSYSIQLFFLITQTPNKRQWVAKPWSKLCQPVLNPRPLSYKVTGVAIRAQPIIFTVITWRLFSTCRGVQHGLLQPHISGALRGGPGDRRTEGLGRAELRGRDELQLPSRSSRQQGRKRK